MSDRTDAYSLAAEMRKSRSVLGRIARYYDEHYRGTMRPPESTESAIVLAEVSFVRVRPRLDTELDSYEELLMQRARKLPD